MRALPLLALLMACSSAAPTADSGSSTAAGTPSTTSTSSPGACDPNPTDPTQFVVVGFWNNDPTCSGDPMITNSFPVSEEAGCYCWPGASGENSADSYACDPTAGSFTYTQYNSLTCGEGDDTPTEKTTYLDQCTQDIPQNLYSKIVDYGACGA